MKFFCSRGLDFIQKRLYYGDESTRFSKFPESDVFRKLSRYEKFIE